MQAWPHKLVFVIVQVLVVQAVRPDRLQSAMGVFAAKALGKSCDCIVLEITHL